MQTVLITGGTGMVGSALTKALVSRGYHVIILTRDPAKATQQPGVEYAAWNIPKGNIDREAVRASDYVIHLAGANVAEKRWSEQRKKEIRDSRVNSASLLLKALSDTPNKVRAVFSASAIGFYGPDPQIPNPLPFKETARPAGDFLGKV